MVGRGAIADMVHCFITEKYSIYYIGASSTVRYVVGGQNNIYTLIFKNNNHAL